MQGLRTAFATALAFSVLLPVEGVAAGPASWKGEWPATDFSRHAVPFDEIFSGGVARDGIPAINEPRFVSVNREEGLASTEPVVTVEIAGDARAYPLRILLWHEIVNDRVGNLPLAVTYCPLCNSAVVFDRRVGGRVLDFGVTGKLRHSDLVMYDRETESWWQQFTGEAIVGEMTGAVLIPLPSRMESIALFRRRFPDGRVLVPTDDGMRPYGVNPYAGYDSSSRPFLYQGPPPVGVAPLERVVSVGDEAWTFSLLRAKGTLRPGDLVIGWQPGQASALDATHIEHGRDVGNVTVERETAEGLKNVVHDVSFAFAFRAFRPRGTIHTLEDEGQASP